MPTKRTQEEIDLIQALGKRIRTYRRACGISQAELAKRCGVIEQTILKIELGRVPVSWLMLFRLTRALDVSLEALAGIEPSSERERARG